MTVRITSQAGTRWRSYLSRKIKALPRGGRYVRFLEGFILRGSNRRGRAQGLVLDLPTRLLVTDSAYDTTEDGSVVDPLVTIAPSRDLFDPAARGGESPTKDRAVSSMEASATIAPEFYFASVAPGDALRYTSFRGGGAYTGSGFYRNSYVFNLDQEELQLWPFDNPPYLWARCELRGIQAKSLLRVGVGEDIVEADSAGFQFYSRALDKDRFPETVPAVVCDRRILVDGRDIVVMAIPVTKTVAAYDIETNNTDFGNSAIYFFRMEVTNENGRPVDVVGLDSWVVGTENFASGPLHVPLWSGTYPGFATYPFTGTMPNRLFGDVALTENGDVFWAGMWETSRETNAGDGYVPVKSVVQVDIPLGGAPTATRHHTTVITNAASDGAYGYLSMDDDPTFMPFAQNFHCYAPPGVLPFFVGEVINLDRDSVALNSVPILGSGSSSLVVGDANGVRFLEIPDGAFREPGTNLNYADDAIIKAPRIALTDANKLRPKVGLAIRTETSYPTVKWVELDVVPGTYTLRGIVGTAGDAWEVQPTVTCFQRGESEMQGLLNVQTKESGLLLSYGVDEVGFTLVSKDSGETWEQVEEYAARTGAYYFGSGFFGAALDQMYYEVNDDA